MSLPRMRLIALGAPLAIVMGLAGIWIAKPSGVVLLKVARGTSVQVRLDQPLASDVSKPGDQFTATMIEPVWVDGKVAIPQGARIHGKVVDALPFGKPEGPARLRLTLNSIRMDHTVYELNTTDVAQYGSGYVDRHWEFAGSGSLPGELSSRGRGMLIGALPAARAGIIAPPVPETKDVRMPAEAPLEFRLIEPLVVPHKR